MQSAAYALYEIWKPKLEHRIPSGHCLDWIRGLSGQPDVPPDLLSKICSNAVPYWIPGQGTRINFAGIGYLPNVLRGRKLAKILAPMSHF